MRKLLGVWLLAAGGLVGLAQPALAGHCGACNYPRRCVTPDQCATPCVTATVQYQPVYETHQKVCYRPVYKTECKPETYTTCHTVKATRNVAEEYTVQKP